MRTRFLLVAVVACLATVSLGSTAAAASKYDDRSIVTACQDRDVSFMGILRGLESRDRISDRVLQRLDRRSCWDDRSRDLSRQECQSIIRWLDRRGCSVGSADRWDDWLDRWLDRRDRSDSRRTSEMDRDDCRTIMRWLERHGCTVDRDDDRVARRGLWWLLRRLDRTDWFDHRDRRQLERRWADRDRDDDDLDRRDLRWLLRRFEG